MTRRTLSIAVATAILAIASVAGTATAKSSVDPTTLTPAPPDFFNAECSRQGSQIICTLHFDTVDDVDDEPSGVICGGTELLFSQKRAVVGKRYYSADGLLLRRHFHEDFAGSFTKPGGGTVLWVAHNDLSHTLATPGDVQSGVTKVSGQQIRIFQPDGGTVLIDAGRVVVDESNGELVAWSGPKHFDDYFVRGDAHALDALCDAVA
jgi:hypothetical protein